MLILGIIIAFSFQTAIKKKWGLLKTVPNSNQKTNLYNTIVVAIIITKTCIAFLY